MSGNTRNRQLAFEQVSEPPDVVRQMQGPPESRPLPTLIEEAEKVMRIDSEQGFTLPVGSFTPQVDDAIALSTKSSATMSGRIAPLLCSTLAWAHMATLL